MPRAYNLGGVPVKVLFAPDHTPELEIMKQMLKADRAGSTSRSSPSPGPRGSTTR